MLKTKLTILNNSLLVICIFFAIITINEYQIYVKKIKQKSKNKENYLENGDNENICQNNIKNNGTKASNLTKIYQRKIICVLNLKTNVNF